MALTILHASDLQFGKPYVEAAGRAFVSLAHAVEPDVVVVAGDLTQRAKSREFDGVRALLADLPDVPIVTTPGNHDVPLYRVWERLFFPYRNWRRGVSPELDTVVHVPGATFVALNSSAPRRAVVGGRIDDRQVAFARRAFRDAPPDDLRALVVHHHFVATPDGRGGRVLPRGRALLRAFEDMGVELILGGHVHQAHRYSSRVLVPGPGPGIALVACGTTTSTRGRGAEAGANSLNVIRVSDDAFEVVTHRFDPPSGVFAPRSPVRIPRPRAGVRG